MIWAIIRTQKTGFHRWSKAPAEVKFLRNEHRHIFLIELWIEQNHNERDIEYLIEKRKLDYFLEVYFGQKNIETSCETIATDIKERWEKFYLNRKIKVSVFEDNENGTLIE